MNDPVPSHNVRGTTARIWEICPPIHDVIIAPLEPSKLGASKTQTHAALPRTIVGTQSRRGRSWIASLMLSVRMPAATLRRLSNQARKNLRRHI